MDMLEIVLKKYPCQNEVPTIKVYDDKVQILENENVSVYNYAHIYKDITQKHFFEQFMECILLQLHLLQHVLIMAYGITESGKSYTFFGDKINVGIFHRTIDYLLPSYTITISAFELYNKAAYDLLDLTTKKQKKQKYLSENNFGIFHVKGLREMPLHNMEDARKLIEMILNAKETGPGKKNSEAACHLKSSRSHLFIELKVLKKSSPEKPSQLICFNDLAGIEKRQANLNARQIKEFDFINDSLFCLRPCITSKKEGIAISDMIWKQSILTKVLKKYFVSNTLIRMIVTLNPESDLDNVKGCLRFSAINGKEKAKTTFAFLMIE